jgi:hypothetical protein
MAPVVAGQPAQAGIPAAAPAVTLTAATQPLQALRPLPQPMALASVQQLAPLQPQNPLAQQVGFHVAFLGDFISTGAVLFAREFAIPGALLHDINSGTPAPVAVSQALQTFAQIELEAGRDLVGFAAQYVSFQLNFFANLVTMPVAAAVSAFTTSPVAGLQPVSAIQRSAPQVHGAATSADEVTTTPQQPKKFRSTVVESKSTNSTTAKTLDVDSVASDRAGGPHKQANAGSTTSSATGDAGQADAGNQHKPQRGHHGNSKGNGDKGD